ncbi:uncharacterized protein F4807DRAFT_378079 [Annulohypoxylon truncatum]|uniref:uncharacterized protein n=1 Tax=Annulohypoxylon truncatum TaxID=327061 RepID=UPI0020071E6D|nr:uncharacterized protein F4807DRAFT_378079 [Annulohypoxylon truncatum]KAI1211825.1 hypothetical protein F4807DRAFT_378079 [Annulohypoxylon truncatum]
MTAGLRCLLFSPAPFGLLEPPAVKGVKDPCGKNHPRWLKLFRSRSVLPTASAYTSTAQHLNNGILKRSISYVPTYPACLLNSKLLGRDLASRIVEVGCCTCMSNLDRLYKKRFYEKVCHLANKEICRSFQSLAFDGYETKRQHGP